MKKLMAIVMAVLMITPVWGGQQPAEPPSGGGGEVPSHANSPGLQVATWERLRANFSVEIWQATRGATDSLLLTLQSTNNINDTTSWGTVWNKFGGATNGSIVATGHYQKNFLLTLAQDTSRFMGRWYRLIASHSLDALDTLGTDTSTYQVTVLVWGEKFER